jgi:hypothetical protein
MSNSIFVTALGISLIYSLLKFAEMRFIIKENKPFKVIFQDTIFVYLSIVCGHYIIEQLAPLAEMGAATTKAFTDNPDF